MLLIILKKINQLVALLRTSSVYVPKKRTEFYIQYKTPTYRFAYGNYKSSGYTSRKRKKKYFAGICSVLGPIVLAKTEGPKILTTYARFFNWSCLTSAVLQHMT